MNEQASHQYTCPVRQCKDHGVADLHTSKPSSGPRPCASLSLGFLVCEMAVLVPTGSYPGVGSGVCETPGAQRVGRRGQCLLLYGRAERQACDICVSPVCGSLFRQISCKHFAVPNPARGRGGGGWGFSRSKLRSLPSWSSHSSGL